MFVSFYTPEAAEIVSPPSIIGLFVPMLIPPIPRAFFIASVDAPRVPSKI